MAVRRLSLVLDLDSGQFSTRIVDAQGKVKALSNEVATATGKVNAFEGATHRSVGTLDHFNKQIWKMQLTLYSVTFLFGGFTSGLVKMNAEAQRSIALLTGLSKSQSQLGRQASAAADFKYLREFAKQAPYDLGVLTDTFVKLKASGIDPTAGAMRALVDGVASFGGNADTLNRATTAIAQMAGKGVVSMEELRQQLGEAMPTALRIMARSAGKSIPEFVDEVSKGRVSWKSVQDKFFAELAKESEGASERLKNTLGGQTAIVKTNLRELALAVGGFQSDGTFAQGGFMSELTNGMKDLNAWLANPETSKGAKELGENLASLVVTAKDFVGFINDMSGVIQFGATLLIVSKAAAMTKAGLTALAASQLGLQTVTRASVKEALAERAAKMAVIAQTYKNQAASAAEAKSVVAAYAAKKAATEGNIIALKAEAAQLNANMILNRKAQAEAMAEAAIARRNAAAGFGSTVVGAGSQSRPAQVRAVEASNSLKLNQQQLARTTALLAAEQAALNATTVAMAGAQTVAAGAIARTTLVARTGAAAMGVLRTVMGFLGGPLVGGILLAGTALVVLAGRFKEGERAVENYKVSSADLDTKLKENAKWLATAGVEANKLGVEAEDAGKRLEPFGGQVGEAANKLRTLATEARKARIEIAQTLVTQAKANLSTATQAANHISFKEKFASWMTMNGEVAGGMAGERWLSANDRRAKTISPAQAQLEAAKKQLAEAEKLSLEAVAKSNDVQAEFAFWEENEKAGKAASKGGKGGKGKVSPADRLDANIERLGASQPAIDALIDSMDEGSKAAEEMRAKIAGMRKMGQSISPEQEKTAINAARENARLQKAYEILNDVIQDYRSNSSAASEAVASLGDSTNPTTNAIEKFERKLDQAKETFLRLNPELLKSPERLAEFNRVVEQSKADYKLIQVANAARGLADEMDRLNDQAIDPNMQVWDAWASKMREIETLLAAARALPQNADTAKTISSLEGSRASYTDDYLARIEKQAQLETQSIEDGLLTQDEARQRAFEREIERIEALTDISKLNDEERARWGARMAVLREEMTDAATKQYERDTESSAEKMAREWSDLNGNLKAMTGSWMEDFKDQLISGEFSFEEFMGNILMDFLEALLKAQMASMMQPAMDGIAGGLGKIGSAVLGSMMGIPGVVPITPAGIGANGLMQAPGHHSGGIVGGTPTFMRMVSPAMFAGAQRFHDGGFPGMKNNEVAAILQKGEGVFTKDQMKALGGSGTPNVQVNVINESGTSLQAEQGGGRFDGDTYIIDVLVDALSRPGKARNAVNGAR